MIGIIGAMEEEVSQLIEAMEEKEKVTPRRQSGTRGAHCLCVPDQQIPEGQEPV